MSCTADDYENARAGEGGDRLFNPEEIARQRTAAQQHTATFSAAEARFKILNGRGFTAEQVCEGAGISGDALTNYLRKQKLQLFSPPTGQGRARRFCLADIYVVATVATLADLSGQTKYCSFCVWRHFALDPIFQTMGLSDHDAPALPDGFEAVAEQYLEDVERDTRNGVASFFWRDKTKPFLIILRSAKTYSGEFVSFFQQDLHGDLLTQFGSGIFVNLTALFTEVDMRLEHAIWGAR